MLRLADRNGIEPSWIEAKGGRRITSPGLGLARWCAVCLTHPQAFWRDGWTREPGICLAHRCWLVDQCSVCGSRAGWRSLRFRRCKCGANLDEAPSRPWSQDLLRLLSSLSNSDDPGWSAIAIKQRWKLAEVLGALDTHGLRGKPLKRASTSHVAHYAFLVERGAHLVVHADNELPQWFDRLRTPSCAGNQVQLVREAWPGLLPLLKKQLKPGAFQWISDRLDQYVEAVQLSGSGIQRRRRRGQKPSGVIQLAARLGVGVDRVPGLLDSCDLHLPERRTKAGRRMLMVSDAAFDVLSGQLNDQIAARAAQRRFGISAERIEQLARALMVTRSGEHYSASSIENLLRQVIAGFSMRTSSIDSEPPAFSPLPHVLKVSITRAQTVEFFQAMLSGTIRATSVKPSVRSAADIAVNESDVKAWLLSRLPSKDFLLLSQAALRLGLKQEVIYHLVRVGLLSTSFRRAGRRAARVVDLDEIDRFVRTLAPLSAVARVNGVDFRSAKAWAGRQGIEVVSGPGIDGGRQFIVRIGF